MKPVIPAIVAAAVLMMAGCTADTTPDEAAGKTSASDEHDHAGGGPDGPPQPTIVDLGAPVSLSGNVEGEKFEVTYAVTKVDVVKKDENGNAPGGGMVFMVAELEVRSYSGSHSVGTDNDDYVFALVDKKDEEYEQSKRVVGDALAGTVAGQDVVTGTITFEVPAEVAGDGKVELTAKGANGGDQTVMWRQD